MVSVLKKISCRKSKKHFESVLLPFFLFFSAKAIKEYYNG